MRHRCLQITYRNGRALAAYFHVAESPDRRSHRCERAEPGMIVDFDAEDRPVGVEITAPSLITFDGFNRLLGRLGLDPVTRAEFDPLHAA